MDETDVPVLVLGVGNVLMRDDGVGVRVVEALAERSLGAHVGLVDGGTAAFDALTPYRGGRKLVVVDAVSGGEEPGAVYRIPLEEFDGPAGPRGLSLHEVGVIEALTLLELTGVVWEKVVIFGIQPGDVSWGEELTESVARVVPRVIDLVEREISENRAGDLE